MATYRIHPGIGIARLGNSDSEFYLAPETPAAMPLACDSFGNPLHGPDGVTPVPVKTFKDAQGRVKRILPDGLEVRRLDEIAAAQNVQIRRLNHKRDSLEDIFLKAMEAADGRL